MEASEVSQRSKVINLRALDELSQGDAQERRRFALSALEESALTETQLLDFGTFKERLRSLAVEEIGQAGEGLPRVGGGWFGPLLVPGGLARAAACIRLGGGGGGGGGERKYSCLYLFFKEGIRTGHQLTYILTNN